MSEKILSLLGLMRKANSIEPGESNTGDAVHGGKAKLLLLASDATENAKKRAEGYAAGRNVQTVPLPYTKLELSASLGHAGCSMAAVTDIGFANALMKALSDMRPEEYGEAAAETEKRFLKSERRRQESKAHEKNMRTGKRRTNI